jgi:hypothetical protein
MTRQMNFFGLSLGLTLSRGVFFQILNSTILTNSDRIVFLGDLGECNGAASGHFTCAQSEINTKNLDFELRLSNTLVESRAHDSGTTFFPTQCQSPSPKSPKRVPSLA